MFNRLSHRAFTIIELLVVITILAVLVALALPTLKNARDTAMAVRCASNMRTITLASAAYIIDNKERMPYGSYQAQIVGQVISANITWDDLLDSYMGGSLTQAEIVLNGVTTKLPCLICPADSPRNNSSAAPSRSYTLNHTIGGNNTSGYVGVPTGQPVNGPPSIRLFQVIDPMTTIIFIETPNYAWLGGVRGRCAGTDLRYAAEQLSGVVPSGVSLTPGITGFMSHPRETFNYAFVDGHVAPFYPPDTDGIYVTTLPRGIATGAPNHWAWTATGSAKGYWSLDPNDY